MGLFGPYGRYGRGDGSSLTPLARTSAIRHLVCKSTHKNAGTGMTNTIAVVLGVLILGALAVDVMLYGTEHLLFLSRKFADLIEWLAFWR